MSDSTSSEAQRSELAASFQDVRSATTALCEPLGPEDHVVQAMDDVSPPKWHLAHTTWFFDTFVLEPYSPGYEPVEPAYRVLFNSYYQSVGEQHPRPRRGLLSRPTIDEVHVYRQRVDGLVLELIHGARPAEWSEIARRVTIGIHHEQQHQELLLMDLKYNFSCNPLYPVYVAAEGHESRPAPELSWHEHAGGVVTIGHAGDGFCFDNETPQHQVLIHPYRLASRCVTSGEYLEFMEAGGYDDPRLWLADGWATVCEHGWRAPLYWHQKDGAWYEYTLGGARPVKGDEPVVHVSYYEADAFARWAGARLPTELEWEHAADDPAVRQVVRQQARGNFVESRRFHPDVAPAHGGLVQMFGDVWEWTQSPYSPYPGYRPLPGALGEYNGKFMCSQFVQRGGSCLTPQSHIRATYRNFFYPHQRWNTQGLRLAADID